MTNSLFIKQGNADIEHCRSRWGDSIKYKIHFIDNFLTKYWNKNITKNKNIISLACGLGSEESLLLPYCDKLVLLDLDSNIIERGKELYKEKNISTNKVEFVVENLEQYKTKDKFGFIYSAVPSNWVHNFQSYKGIPDFISNFVKKNLDKNGICIIRLHAGSSTSLDEEKYRKDVEKSLENTGLSYRQISYSLRAPYNLIYLFHKKDEKNLKDILNINLYLEGKNEESK